MVVNENATRRRVPSSSKYCNCVDRCMATEKEWVQMMWTNSIRRTWVIVMFTATASLAAGPSSAAGQDRVDPRSAIDALFEGMRQADARRVRSVLAPDARFALLPEAFKAPSCDRHDVPTDALHQHNSEEHSTMTRHSEMLPWLLIFLLPVAPVAESFSFQHLHL